MFYLRYVFAELRRRKGRTVLTSLGLAVGVGLVVAVTALSSGLDEAQSKVLAPLTGVGTDMSVKRPVTIEAASGESGATGDISAGPGPGGGLSASEQKQLEKENGGIGLDLAAQGKPGEKFTTNEFVTTDLSFPERQADKVAEISGVEQVGRALTLNQLTISGTVPEQGEAMAMPAPAPGGAGEGSEQSFDQSSVTGIDASAADLAPVTTAELVEGRYLGEGAKDEAMISQAYANSDAVEVGDTIEVGEKRFDVVGIVKAPLGGESSDFYVPLATLQKLSDREGRINVLQVRAGSAEQVDATAAEIEAVFPGSDVTTASDLADRVSGSLVDAKNLSSKLGTALAVVALLAAFGIASLLTLSSVNKRTRELGTLKALGWRQWLVVRQVTGESVVQGLLGGLAGAVIGVGAAAAIGALGIDLEASVGAAANAAGGLPGGPFGQGAVEAGTSTVSLGAPGRRRNAAARGRPRGARRPDRRRRRRAQGGAAAPGRGPAERRVSRPGPTTDRSTRRSEAMNSAQTEQRTPRAASVPDRRRGQGLRQRRRRGPGDRRDRPRDRARRVRRHRRSLAGPASRRCCSCSARSIGPRTGRSSSRAGICAARARASSRELRLKTIGFIFQQFNLIPTLSAQENVEVAIAPTGLSRTQRSSVAWGRLADVGLADRASHLPSQLSGGEQQRVAIARALANEPDVLLADEPTGNLDSSTGEAILDLLYELWRERGLTVVLITHDAAVAERAPRVIRLADGRVESDLAIALAPEHPTNESEREVAR